MAPTLRVITFNVAYGAGEGGIDGVVRHLRSLGPADLICLQECDRGTLRYGAGDHAAAIAQGTGYPHWRAGGYFRHFIKVFGKASPVRIGWEGGKALLARHPIHDFEELAVTDSAGNLHSWVVAAHLNIRSIEHVVYVLHWPRDHPGWVVTRDFTVGLADRDPPDRYVLAAGDFNATSGDPDLAPVTAKLTNPAVLLGGDSTACDQALGVASYDYVLYRGAQYVPRSYREHCALPHPSDHRSVDVTFEETQPEAPERDALRAGLASARGRYSTELARQYVAPAGPIHGVDPARAYFEDQKRKRLATIQSEIDRLTAELRGHGCR